MSNIIFMVLLDGKRSTYTCNNMVFHGFSTENFHLKKTLKQLLSVASKISSKLNAHLRTFFSELGSKILKATEMCRRITQKCLNRQIERPASHHGHEIWIENTEFTRKETHYLGHELSQQIIHILGKVKVQTSTTKFYTQRLLV